MTKKRSRGGQSESKLRASKRQEIGNAAPSSPRALPSLPQEVLERIFEYACILPSLPQTDLADVQQPPATLNMQLPYDSATAFNLLLTSRSVYAHLWPVFCANIRLQRPSNLAAFHRALLQRPELRNKVERIVVAPSNKLPSTWWPLNPSVAKSKATEIFCADQPLRRSQDKSAVTHDAAGLPPCAPRFLSEAIDSAAKDLGVTLQPPGADETPVKTRGWLIRIFEVQGAAELYEEEMLRIQREERDLQQRRATRSQCATMQCAHFPRLVITATRPTPLKTSVPQQDGPVVGRSKGSLFVPRSHLQAHLARSAGTGTLFDRFDHPSLFARSGLDVCRFDGKGRPELDDARASEQLKEHTFAGEVGLDGKSFESVLKLITAVKRLTGVAVRVWPEVLGEGVRLREEKLGWRA